MDGMIATQAAPSLPPVVPSDGDALLRVHLKTMRRLALRVERVNLAWLNRSRDIETILSGRKGNRRLYARMDALAADLNRLLDAALGVVPQTTKGLRDKAEIAVLAEQHRMFTEQSELPGMLAGEVLYDLLDRF